MRRPSVVVVGPAGSPHLQGWLAAVDRSHYRITLVATDSHESDARGLADLGIDVISKKNWIEVLASLLTASAPQILHTMNLQATGYPMMDHLQKMLVRRSYVWLASSWGSDISKFSFDAGHIKRLTSLLSSIDYLHAECSREYDLCGRLGLTVACTDTIPMFGGFSQTVLDEFTSHSVKPSARRSILVKGYQHFAGQAQTALDALEALLAADLDFNVNVFSATADVQERTRLMNLKFANRVRVIDYQPLELMRREFLDARVYLSASRSDGLSTAAIEAALAGAYPVQSATACLSSYIDSGQTGTLLNTYSSEDIAHEVRRALLDDALVDGAAARNSQMVRTKFAQTVIRARISSLYESLLS